MKFTLIQRKESGPWYLRVRLNGLDQKINLGINSKREANKLAPVKYDELVRTATVDGAVRNTDVVDLLRKNGAKSGAEDSIHIAAVMGNIGAIKRHLTAGVNVNATDDRGSTPLDWAIKQKHAEIADLLRKHGGKTGEELKAEGN